MYVCGFFCIPSLEMLLNMTLDIFLVRNDTDVNEHESDYPIIQVDTVNVKNRCFYCCSFVSYPRIILNFKICQNRKYLQRIRGTFEWYY